MYGICNLSLVPCRKSPSDRSEMVNQLLFGDTFEILEEQEKWVKIKGSFDDYISWIAKKQYLPIFKKTFSELNKEPQQLAADLIQFVTDQHGDSIIPILPGSNLPGLKNHVLEIEKSKYKYDGDVIKPGSSKHDRSSVLESAYLFLNAPYLWGGRSPFGIDCSGFTQLVFKLNGIELLRDAWQQALNGKPLDFVEEAQPGDLAFFDNDRGKIIHVGIILGKNKIIHASGKVRIDKLDHYGIYNEEKKAYTHQLRIIRAML